METIKTIAGKILLYFYSLQRSDYSKLQDLVLTFQMRHFSNDEKSPVLHHRNNEVMENLLKITGNDNNLYHGLGYLYEKHFIYMSKTTDNVSDNFLNFSVSSDGIDIVEGKEKHES